MLNHFQKRERHARLPDSVLRDSFLCAESKLVYAAIARHTFKGSEVYIGQRKIAELLGMSQSSVSRRIKELLELNHIEKSDSRAGRRSGYHLISNVFVKREINGGRNSQQGISATVRKARAFAQTNTNPHDALDEIFGKATA